MAITQLFVYPTGEVLFNDTALGNAVDGVKSTLAYLNSVSIDNTSGATGNYVKLYNLQSGSVIPGTTIPDEIVYGPSGAETSITYWTGAEEGKVFPIALSATCEASGATGATGPGNAVVVTISYQ